VQCAICRDVMPQSVFSALHLSGCHWRRKEESSNDDSVDGSSDSQSESSTSGDTDIIDWDDEPL
jgi:hypothetical protein